MTNEKCPKCGSTEFMVARNMKATRVCKCGTWWDPPTKKGAQ